MCPQSLAQLRLATKISIYWVCHYNYHDINWQLWHCRHSNEWLTVTYIMPPTHPLPCIGATIQSIVPGPALWAVHCVYTTGKPLYSIGQSFCPSWHALRTDNFESFTFPGTEGLPPKLPYFLPLQCHIGHISNTHGREAEQLGRLLGPTASAT